jgi:hypothetical protein
MSLKYDNGDYENFFGTRPSEEDNWLWAEHEERDKKIFNEWLGTFISEKKLNIEATVFEVEGEEWGLNIIPCEVVLEHIRMASPDIQAKIKDELVRIDFLNGNVMDYFRWLANPLAR